MHRRIQSPEFTQHERPPFRRPAIPDDAFNDGPHRYEPPLIGAHERGAADAEDAIDITGRVVALGEPALERLNAVEVAGLGCRDVAEMPPRDGKKCSHQRRKPILCHGLRRTRAEFPPS